MSPPLPSHPLLQAWEPLLFGKGCSLSEKSKQQYRHHLPYHYQGQIPRVASIRVRVRVRVRVRIPRVALIPPLPRQSNPQAKDRR